LQRLAREFKRDAHAARELAPQEQLDETVTFRFAHGDEAAYRVTKDGQVQVTHRNGDRRAREDTFSFPTFGRPHLETDEIDQRPIVRLRFEPKKLGPGSERLPASSVEAVVGKDHRLDQEGRSK
jgi:hypothetical protein